MDSQLSINASGSSPMGFNSKGGVPGQSSKSQRYHRSKGKGLGSHVHTHTGGRHGGSVRINEPVDGVPMRNAFVPVCYGKGKEKLVVPADANFTDAELELDDFVAPNNEYSGLNTVVQPQNEGCPSIDAGPVMEANESPIHDCLFQGVGLLHGPSCKLYGKFDEAGGNIPVAADVSVVEKQNDVHEVFYTVENDAGETAVVSEQFALVPADNDDYLCDEDMYYEDEFEEAYDEELEPENSFHSFNSTSSFVKKLSAIDLPKSNVKDTSGDVAATSGSSKRKTMDNDIDDTATTGPKKPRV